MASPGFLWLIARLFPAKHWDQKYRIDEFLYTKTANRFVVELCQGLVPGKAIDLGGGEGRNSLWLAQQGWRVENIDFSRVALAKFDRWVATEHPQLAANCTTTKADARGFRAKLAPADLGVIAYLQIPQDAIASAIATLVAQLAPGATLVGVWHSRSNLTAQYSGPQDARLLPEAGGVRRILNGLPVEIEVLEEREGQVQTKAGLRPSKTLVLKARVLAGDG